MATILTSRKKIIDKLVLKHINKFIKEHGEQEDDQVLATMNIYKNSETIRIISKFNTQQDIDEIDRKNFDEFKFITTYNKKSKKINYSCQSCETGEFKHVDNFDEDDDDDTDL